jgi:gluconokinase
VTVSADAIVVMGVAGSGKTTVGKALAAALDFDFADADDFHSAENRAKMTAGHPLTDADRQPWLAAVREYIEARIAAGRKVVVACSALKESYRQELTPSTSTEIRFVYLNATRELTASRLRGRHAHFMKENMLASQFATLEAPTSQEAVIVDASHPVPVIVASVIESLSKTA